MASTQEPFPCKSILEYSHTLLCRLTKCENCSLPKISFFKYPVKWGFLIFLMLTGTEALFFSLQTGALYISTLCGRRKPWSFSSKLVVWRAPLLTSASLALKGFHQTTRTLRKAVWKPLATIQSLHCMNKYMRLREVRLEVALSPESTSLNCQSPTYPTGTK